MPGGQVALLPTARACADRYAEVQAALPRTEITIKFGDKEAKGTAFETNAFQAAKAAGVDKKLINNSLCAIVRDTKGEPLGLVEGQWDMERPLEQDCSVELCDFETKANAPAPSAPARLVFSSRTRHSLATTDCSHQLLREFRRARWRSGTAAPTFLAIRWSSSTEAG